MRTFRLLAGLSLFGLFFCAAAPAHSELPLTVEELITAKKKIRLDLSLSYANTDSKHLSTGDPILIQIGPTAFITLPGIVSENTWNMDTLAGSIGLRHGLTGDTEIYARSTFIKHWYRHDNGETSSSHSESRFADAWMGLNHRFKEDDATPALLGFAEAAVAENIIDRTAHFESFMLGLTTYKAIDPIVFSLTGAYRLNTPRTIKAQEHNPGNLILLNPTVGFAVNDRVTLTTGMQWKRLEAHRVDGRQLGMTRTSTDLLLGTGYGFGRGNIINTTLKANISGQSGSDFRLNWIYSF